MITPVLGLLSVPLFQAPQPMDELKASYPFGQELCAEATPDNTRMFTADGASIAILNVTSLGPPSTPPLIDRVKVPDCSPDALLYYHHPTSGRHFLFIAGGTMGVWEMELCAGIFSTPPSPCSSYPLDRIEVFDVNFVRKRCVALAVVENNPGSDKPLLFALYAARADTAGPIGASELHAFKLDGTGGAAAHGNVLHFDAATIPGLPSDAVATAIVSDPADPSSLYVALGTGGLCKVNIATTTFTASAVAAPSCPMNPFEQMRDLALVRTATRGMFLYAAMDYGRVLEFHPALGSWQCTQTQLLSAFPTRIAAAVDSGDRVTVAVGLQVFPGLTADSRAPWRKDGLWWNVCLGYGLPDNHAPPDSSVPRVNQMDLFTRDTTVAGVPLTQIGNPVPIHPFWESLTLRRKATSSLRLYLCTTEVQDAEVWRIDYFDGDGSMNGSDGSATDGGGFQPYVTVLRLAGYVPVGVFANDGVFSTTNVQLFFVGSDAGATMISPGLLRIRAPSEPGGVDFVPIDQTTSPCEMNAPPASTSCGGPPPSPWVGSLMGACRWPDASDASREWFMAGAPMWKPVDVSQCTDLPTCTGNTCDPLTTVRWHMGIPSQATYDLGWRLANLKATSPPGGPPTGGWMDPRWWQIPSPPAAQGDERTPSAQYQQAQADPRVDANGTPSVIYCLRAGSDHGLKAFQASSIVSGANQTCTLPGFGEALTTIPSQEALTHPELEIPLTGPNDQCVAIAAGVCESPGEPTPSGTRLLYNNRSDTFAVSDSQGATRYITALAAGFVSTGPLNQPSGCLWDDTEDGTPNTPPKYAGKSLLALYEVTHTGESTFTAPALLRVALGPRVASASGPPGGHAWSVRAKTYGSGSGARTYAFVGDMRGRLVVFDVSGDQLFSSPSPATVPYLPATPVLSSVASFDFPPDPFDGLRPNITDIEIDGNFAYCAVARAGVGIFDITDPIHPILVELLDTPGLAMGITLRTDERGFRQMLVGDNNCGIRLYGRPGEGP